MLLHSIPSTPTLGTPSTKGEQIVLARSAITAQFRGKDANFYDMDGLRKITALVLVSSLYDPQKNTGSTNRVLVRSIPSVPTGCLHAPAISTRSTKGEQMV